MKSLKRPAHLAIVFVCFAMWNAAGQQNSQPAAESQPSSDVAPQPSQPTSQPTSQSIDQSEEVLRVTSRMVLVDAVVTDNSGKPISGLKADDFKIRENGNRQTIRAFGARSPELLRQQAGTSSPHALAPGMFTNIPDFRPEYGPLTILLIDSLNTPNFDQPYMRDALIKYLQGMGTQQNVAVFSLGIRLGLVQNLNADPQILQEALKRIASRPSLKKRKPNASASPEDSTESRARLLAADLLGVGTVYDKERQISMMQSSVLEFFPDQAVVQTDARVRLTLDALQKISRHVAGYRGRKNLIWLSAAFPLSIDPMSAGLADARDYQREVQETANLLTNNEVAVYPVDVRGLVGNFLPDAASDTQRHGSFHGSAVTGVIRAGGMALASSHMHHGPSGRSDRRARLLQSQRY